MLAHQHPVSIEPSLFAEVAAKRTAGTLSAMSDRVCVRALCCNPLYVDGSELQWMACRRLHCEIGVNIRPNTWEYHHYNLGLPKLLQYITGACQYPSQCRSEAHR